MSIEIPPRDPRVHVLSVSDGGTPIPHQTYLTGTDADAAPLRAALGADIDAAHAEVFAVSDIAPMSLRDYLAQAHDVPPGRLTADAARLDALSGHVVVLAPRAVEPVRELRPAAHLTHIGAYPTAEADDTPVELPRAAREPGVATPGASTGSPAQRRTIVWAVLGALALAALLILLSR